MVTGWFVGAPTLGALGDGLQPVGALWLSPRCRLCMGLEGRAAGGPQAFPLAESALLLPLLLLLRQIPARKLCFVDRIQVGSESVAVAIIRVP